MAATRRRNPNAVRRRVAVVCLGVWIFRGALGIAIQDAPGEVGGSNGFVFRSVLGSGALWAAESDSAVGGDAPGGGKAIPMSPTSVYDAYPPTYNLLMDADGQPIHSVAAWEARRPVLLDTMLREVYGYAPPPPEATVVRLAEDRADARGGRARLRRLVLEFTRDGRTMSLPLAVFTPARPASPAAAPSASAEAGAGEGGVPVFLLLNNRGLKAADPDAQEPSEFWPVDDLLARGYGAAVMRCGDAAPDKAEDGFASGVFGLMDGGRRDETSWGTLAGWAWAASRCREALAALDGVDAARIAVVGHSRGGKTAILAAATDPGFAMAVSNDSGCGGMALARRCRGESIADINRVFPHWFSRRFHTYDGRDGALDFDAHFLAAAIAPRALYAASAQDDAWADPEGEWTTLTLADPVYRLYGLGGIGTAWPEVGRPVAARGLGYHVRAGGHDLTRYDWARFMDFADRQGWGR